MLLQVCDIARQWIAKLIVHLFPLPGSQTVRVLTAYAVAGAGGLVVERGAGGDAVYLAALFDVHKRLVPDGGARWAARSSEQH